MKNLKRLRATVTIIHEYTADPVLYGNVKTVKDMIDIDTKNFNDDPFLFLDSVLNELTNIFSIKIEEVKND